MLRSVTFYIVIICIVAFFILQYGDAESVQKPEKGKVTYGTENTFDHAITIQQSLNQLLQNIEANRFTTYPVGFYKEVVLNDMQKEKIYRILAKILPMNAKEIKQYVKNQDDNQEPSQRKEIKVKETVTYEQFCSTFDEIDHVIGGGSDYRHERLYSNTSVPVTYENAMKNYNDFINKDHISGAYARLYCDYMGIVLAIMPIFLAVTRMLKDKRAKAQDVIYAKKTSSAIIILSRYVSILIMLLIPVILASFHPLFQSIYIGKRNGVSIDYLAFIKLALLWLFPTILFVVACSFFLSELFGGLVSILIQTMYWVLSIFASSNNIVGSIGKNLIPRFNKVGEYEIYARIFQELILNRLLYVFLSIIFIIATILIYDFKRKDGGRCHEALFLHSKRIH